jgi:hypothetical protein
VLRLLLGTVLAAGVCVSDPARAQLISYPAEPPAVMVRDALASPYGTALLEQFARAVETVADPTCLQGKGLDAAKLKERGRDLFQTWGSRGMEMIAANHDPDRYQAEIVARAGKGAAQEIERLRETPDVQRYVAIERPARLAKILDYVTDEFRRYLLVQRIKFGPFHPLETGDERLLRINPAEATEQALERFVAEKRKSRQLNRFLELSEASGEAVAKAIKPEFARNLGPAALYRGVEADLFEICIGSQR